MDNNQWLFPNDYVQEFIDNCKKQDISEEAIKKILDISNNRRINPYYTLTILTKGRKRLKEYNVEKYLK